MNNLTSKLSISALYEQRFKEIAQALGTKLAISFLLTFYSKNDSIDNTDEVSCTGEFLPNNYHVELESEIITTRPKQGLTFWKKASVKLVPSIVKEIEGEPGTIEWNLEITLSVSYSEPKDNLWFHHKLITIPAIFLLEPTVTSILNKWIKNKPLPCELIKYFDISRENADVELYDKDKQKQVWFSGWRK